MNFLKSYDYMDPMLILIQIPHLLYLKGILFESCGCLLLVCRDDIGFSEFTIYEMMKGYSVWTVRYHVDTDNFMTSLFEGWSIRSTVWSIILGKREEGSFLVINLSGKVVQYSLISKTLHEIYDCRSNQLDDNHDDDELLQHRVLIGEMEALGARGVAIDYLDCLKQTRAGETNKLAALTKVLVETQASIHEKEGHVTKMDLND
nr:hypothetical protein [Tanacetum cinerariifolium]